MKPSPASLKRAPFVLLISVFFVAVCGLAYELLLGSLATQLLGNPVLQYSLTIGIYMSALGVGSYLSRFIIKDLLLRFIQLEIILGILGGLSIMILRFVFISMFDIYFICHIILLTIFGTLVGLEIPILTRVLKEFGSLRTVISNVLTIDYIGGLVISVAYPLILYPILGSTKTSIMVGVTNIAVGIFCLFYFKAFLNRQSSWVVGITSVVFIILLLIAFVFSGPISDYFSRQFYNAEVMLEVRTPYQTLAITKDRENISLFIDGHLQFSSIDEYRYHEAMVFALFYKKPDIHRVLVLGGGDGLAVRELLHFPSVEDITLVDLDPVMTELSRTHPLLLKVNRNCLNDPKVTIINDDAYHHIGTTSFTYDAIIADFPDPHDESIAKLYSVEFYRFLATRLSKGGVFVTQATSAFHAAKAYWCIYYSMKEVFSHVIPYHIPIRSLGDWGFHLAYIQPGSPEAESTSLPAKPTKENVWFTEERWKASQLFGWDEMLTKDQVYLNTYEHPILYSYVLDSWEYF